MLQLWKPASPGACSTSRGHCTTRGPRITTREKALVVAKTQHRQKEINKLKKNLSECLVSLFQRISFQCFSSNNKPRRSLMCELTGITHFILHLCFFYSLSKGNLCRVLLLELAQPPHHKAFPDHSGQEREPFNSRYHSYIFLFFFHPLIQSTQRVMGYTENSWVTPDITLLYCELLLLHVFLCSDSDNLKSRDFLTIQNCKEVRI